MNRKLTPTEKAARARQRKIDRARQYTTGTYIRKFVAPLFQKMVRAEFGATPDCAVGAIVEGELRLVSRVLGECVCVTCGLIKSWDSGIKGMHTGHFLASRRNAILFEEDNVAPQCSSCNYFRSGAPQEFRQWMVEVRGIETVERLERLKTETRTFTRDELVDMRIEFSARLKAAEERMT